MTVTAAFRTAAPVAAEAIHDAYARLADAFGEVTARARGRFERREWAAAQADARERLALWPAAVDAAVDDVRDVLDDRRRVPAEAVELKWLFVDLCAARPDRELAETFYNSVTRRVFHTVGSQPDAEFTESVPVHRAEGRGPVYRTYPAEAVSGAVLARILGDAPLSAAWADLAGDAEAAAALYRAQAGDGAVRALEVLPALFFRNKGAYLVGRVVRAQGGAVPLVLALTHPPEGVRVDAVLTTSDEVNVVFGFTRSYFHVDTDRPCAMISFLRTLMPRKPVHEMYTALGWYKHGKTELYRELRAHLARGGARFALADGIPGMVMSVFTLPSFNVVFKVIKDRFAAPKEISRDEVKRKYELVFVRDRVGRLADAQEFEHLEFPRACFGRELLARLLDEASGSVQVEGDRVVVRHVYTERRVRPLDLYLREQDDDAARAAILDYGLAIKELAAADLFAGDLLLKNFGVTRHGRVIFYDYDEIQPLTEVRFRHMPKARHDDDDMGGDPWFSVDPGDIFPEEFLPFLVPAGPLREAFLQAHGDLLTVRFWREMQQRQKDGELPDFFPYPPQRRLRPDAA